MSEIWKPIPGWPEYEASSIGRIRSTKWNKIKILSISSFKTGYARVGLYDGKKSVSLLVHRLVATAFLPNPENHPQVNHLDGNKQNNYVGNLKWESTSDNQIHSQAVLKNLNARANFKTTEEREAIIARAAAGECGASIARSLGVNKSCISRLLRGKTYIHQ